VPSGLRFEWDEANEEKLLRRHGVSAIEAEQCFLNRPAIRRRGKSYLLMGQTDEGRMLLLVFQRKPENRVRVYSARDLMDDEKAVFRRTKR
jgi:uncharacterized DUF497 family protein